MPAKKAAKTADDTDTLAVLPPETPEAPPAPAALAIQQPTIGRVVEVNVSQGAAGPRVRRAGVVANAEPGTDALTAIVFLDDFTDTHVTGQPVPLAIRVRATHDDRDDAPPNTWRYCPRCTDTVDVEH
jgi:hypothetical protein